MSYDAKILLDSVSESGNRLTTMEVTFPRIVLADSTRTASLAAIQLVVAQFLC